jgi:hypothetical protein
MVILADFFDKIFHKIGLQEKKPTKIGENRPE